MNPDFGATAGDYARFRQGFPDSLYERLAGHGIGLEGQAVVDLGTGTGTLARGFALRGCRVTGIDRDVRLLEQARALDAEAGAKVDYRVARAEETGLSDACADVVAAGQCWHWFERERAARESARLLVDGGALLIAHFDWIPLAGNVVEATERLIEQHNPDWKLGGGAGIYSRWVRDLDAAGYRAIECFAYDQDAPYTPEAWRGRVRASAGIGASLSPERVTAFDADLAALLEARFPGEVIAVAHRVFAAIGRKRS